MDTGWDAIRAALHRLKESLDYYQTRIEALKDVLTIFQYGRLIELSARILVLVERVQKSVDAADLAATEENVGALVEAALEYLRESGTG